MSPESADAPQSPAPQSPAAQSPATGDPKLAASPHTGSDLKPEGTSDVGRDPKPGSVAARSPAGSAGAKPESLRTVIIAGLANLGIAVAKALAGLFTGSSAMLSEAAHSFADTVTEVLLFTALRQGAREPDDDHPFGYGKATYVWAFLAALFTFVGGAGFAIWHGVTTLIAGEDLSDIWVNYIVLAVSFVLEGISLRNALGQVRSGARRFRIRGHVYLRHTPNTTLTAVTLEDSAALVGLVLAATGLGLSQLTGSPVWDAIASMAIGVLLFAVAATLTVLNVSLLIGRSVPASLREQIRGDLLAIPEIAAVPRLLTMELGPGTLLVAAKADFVDEITAARVEAAADEAERRLRERYEGIRYVFLDPTGRPPGGFTGGVPGAPPE